MECGGREPNMGGAFRGIGVYPRRHTASYACELFRGDAHQLVNGELGTERDTFAFCS